MAQFFIKLWRHFASSTTIFFTQFFLRSSKNSHYPTFWPGSILIFFFSFKISSFSMFGWFFPMFILINQKNCLASFMEKSFTIITKFKFWKSVKGSTCNFAFCDRHFGQKSEFVSRGGRNSAPPPPGAEKKHFSTVKRIQGWK